jgi:hypothetical protein
VTVRHGAVGCEEDSAALVPFADDLEERIGAVLVDGQIAEFVDNEQARLELLA